MSRSFWWYWWLLMSWIGGGKIAMTKNHWPFNTVAQSLWSHFFWWKRENRECFRCRKILRRRQPVNQPTCWEVACWFELCGFFPPYLFNLFSPQWDLISWPLHPPHIRKIRMVEDVWCVFSESTPDAFFKQKLKFPVPVTLNLGQALEIPGWEMVKKTWKGLMG